MQQTTILIVDDIENNRLLLKRHLERLGHTVLMAEHGLQALAMVRTEPVDLIMLDIMMPVMNGYKTLETLKADPELSHIPVVIVSALNDTDSVARCVSLGAEDYLFKPINRVLLEARVNSCLTKKRLRDQEQAAYAAVEEASRTKSEFIALVSHELRNPLAAIRGYADTVLFTARDRLDDQQADCLRSIRLLTEMMGTLINDLNDLSQIETGRLHIEPQAVSLGVTVATAIRTLKGHISAREQQLSIDLPDDLPLVMADDLRLSEILTNLLSNACKYTPSGGAISISARRRGTDWVEVAVHDTGIGMSAADQQRIFEKFFRSADADARKEPGTGLGLNITRYLVEQQGGQIWFESTFRVGTTFYFTLPVAEVAAVSEASPRIVPSSAACAAKELR